MKTGYSYIIIVYATMTDKECIMIPGYDQMVEYNVKGDANIRDSNSIKAEESIATILLKAGTSPGIIEITAKAFVLAAKYFRSRPTEQKQTFPYSRFPLIIP